VSDLSWLDECCCHDSVIKDVDGNRFCLITDPLGDVHTVPRWNGRACTCHDIPLHALEGRSPAS
jgi:hypothetical protein